MRSCELSVHCCCVIQVNNNTIYNWASLNDGNERRRVQPILYTNVMTSAVRKHNHDALVTSARRLGWTVLQVPRVNRAGLPFLKDMYFDAATRFSQCTFYGYSNGDILFNQGLVYSLAAVAKVSMTAVSISLACWCTAVSMAPLHSTSKTVVRPSPMSLADSIFDLQEDN